MWKKEVAPGEKQDWPYSQFSEAKGPFVAIPGQTAMRNGTLVSGGIVEHTRQAISNCMSIMHAQGLNERHIHRVWVSLLDIKRDREGFEQVYDGELFPDPNDRAPRTLLGAEPANGSLIDITMELSLTLPRRGPPGEPELWNGDRESAPDIL